MNELIVYKFAVRKTKLYTKEINFFQSILYKYRGTKKEASNEK